MTAPGTAERRREEGGDSFPLPTPSQSQHSLASMLAGRQAGWPTGWLAAVAATAGCRVRQLKDVCAI